MKLSIKRKKITKGEKFWMKRTMMTRMMTEEIKMITMKIIMKAMMEIMTLKLKGFRVLMTKIKTSTLILINQ